MAIKIAIANQKGGVGKTTTSICLAQELISKGFKVLFIDTDAQCNSTNFYEAKIENQATMMDILCGDEPGANCIQHTPKGDIIASDKQLKDAETIVKVDERRFSHLKRALRGIDSQYDFIIMDNPPNLGVCLKNVLATADYVIMPIVEDAWSLDGVMDFTEAIELAQENNEKLKVLGILTIKAKVRTNKSKRMNEFANTIAEKLNTMVFNTKIRESVACSEALTEYLVPLHQYAPNSTTAIDYREFVTELLEILNK